MNHKKKWNVIGGGTNILIADNGISGYVIQNAVSGIRYSPTRLFVKAGTPLNDVVRAANKTGFAGIESLTDIPGTLGGAIVGNAGAYGQEIRDVVERVRVFDGRRVLTFTNTQCRFAYRNSIFKSRAWIVLSAVMRFQHGKPERLSVTSAKIHTLRLQKFPSSLRCPGSYFQNILLRTNTVSVRRRLARQFPEKILHGKLPAAVLLDAVGMRGKRLGGIRVANYHANLFVNDGQGTARDVLRLAQQAKQKVFRRFGIRLKEEVRLL